MPKISLFQKYITYNIFLHYVLYAYKCTIVDEGINRIKSLEQTLQNLERKKQEKKQVMAACLSSSQGSLTAMPLISNGFSTWNWSNNIVLNVSGQEAYINICTSKKAGLMRIIAFVLQNHQIEVVSAHLSSNHLNCMY